MRIAVLRKQLFAPTSFNVVGEVCILKNKICYVNKSTKMVVVIKLYSGEIKNSKHSQFSSEWSKAPESTPNFAVTSNLHGTSINDPLIPNYE